MAHAELAQFTERGLTPAHQQLGASVSPPTCAEDWAGSAWGGLEDAGALAD